MSTSLLRSFLEVGPSDDHDVLITAPASGGVIRTSYASETITPACPNMGARLACSSSIGTSTASSILPRHQVYPPAARAAPRTSFFETYMSPPPEQIYNFGYPCDMSSYLAQVMLSQKGALTNPDPRYVCKRGPFLTELGDLSGDFNGKFEYLWLPKKAVNCVHLPPPPLSGIGFFQNLINAGKDRAKRMTSILSVGDDIEKSGRHKDPELSRADSKKWAMVGEDDGEKSRFCLLINFIPTLWIFCGRFGSYGIRRVLWCNGLSRTLGRPGPKATPVLRQFYNPDHNVWPPQSVTTTEPMAFLCSHRHLDVVQNCRPLTT